MSKYIPHKKMKPRKEAAPIVFSEEAARRERESWDILTKVRELELKERREKQIARSVEKQRQKAEAKVPPHVILRRATIEAFNEARRRFPIDELPPSPATFKCDFDWLIKGANQKVFRIAYGLMFFLNEKYLEKSKDEIFVPLSYRDCRLIHRCVWASYSPKMRTRETAKIVMALVYGLRRTALVTCQTQGLPVEGSVWVSLNGTVIGKKITMKDGS